MTGRLPLPEPDETILVPYSAAPSGSDGSVFGVFTRLIDRQVASVQSGERELKSAVRKVQKAYTAFQNDDLKGALKALNDAEKKLGRFWFDTPPSGWISYARGVIYLQLDDRARASLWFEKARRGLNHPDWGVNYLGRAWSAQTDRERLSYLTAFYILAPQRFEELCYDAESEEMRTRHLALLESRSVRDDVSAVLTAALGEHFEHQKAAFERLKMAEQQRTQRHVLCEADEIALFENQTLYCDMLLKWFTRSRLPSEQSFTDTPEALQDSLAAAEYVAVDDSEVRVNFTHTRVFGDEEYRIVMRRESDPVGSAPLWKLHEIWEISSDEKFRLV